LGGGVLEWTYSASDAPANLRSTKSKENVYIYV